MAKETNVRRHAQEMEFLKETARLQAERAVRALDAREIIADPEAVAGDLIQAYLANLHGQVGAITAEAQTWAQQTGLAIIEDAEAEDIAQEEEDHFLAIVLPMVTAAMLALQARIQADVEKGLSMDTINAAMDSEASQAAFLGGILSTLRGQGAGFILGLSNRLRDAAIETAAAAGDLAMDMVELAANKLLGIPDSESAILAWITVEDDNVCEDTLENSCAPRHGLEKTWAEWKALGVPGSSVLICSSFASRGSQCRCELENADNVDTELHRVNVSESIAAGKALARAAMGVE